MNWSQQDTATVLRELDSRAEGLTESQASERLEQYGPNELEERGTRSPLSVVLGQFTEVMVIVLLVAAAISFAIGETTDAIMMMIIVILNAFLGFTQEYRAERAMAALKQLSVPKVKVYREGQLREVESVHVVPGDVVLLEAGNRISADGRVLASFASVLRRPLLPANRSR